MFKNVSGQKVTLLVIDVSTNTPKTGDAANLTAYVSKDDGAVTALTDTSATEKDATNAPGLYDFDVSQSESNADKLVFSGKSSTSNVRVIPVTIYTLPASFTSHVAQTGDAYAIVNSGTHGNAALHTILVSTGVKLTAAAVQSIWDALTSALTTANSIGKLLVDNINATISSRASQASLDTLDDYVDGEITTILTAVGTTLDDYVDDLETRLTAALATALQAHAQGIGRVVVGVGSTTTAVVFDTVNGAAPSAVDTFYKDRHLVFTSGALALQACSITNYTGATTTATVSTLTGAPVAAVTAILV